MTDQELDRIRRVVWWFVTMMMLFMTVIVLAVEILDIPTPAPDWLAVAIMVGVSAISLRIARSIVK